MELSRGLLEAEAFSIDDLPLSRGRLGGPEILDLDCALLLADFDQSIDGHASTLYGDPQRLSQIISNLASNACKFSQEDGRVTIRTRLVYPPHRSGQVVAPSELCTDSLTLPAHRSSQWVVIRIEVQDTAAGIDAADLEAGKVRDQNELSLTHAALQSLSADYTRPASGRQERGAGLVLRQAGRQDVRRTTGRQEQARRWLDVLDRATFLDDPAADWRAS